MCNTASLSNAIRRRIRDERGHDHTVGRQREAERGNAVLGFLVMLALIVLVAVLVDFYALLQAKTWGYQVATDAALRGVAYARDYGALYGTGAMALDPATAVDAATAAATEDLHARGITGYTLDVRVLPDPGGGTIDGFPPVPQAAPGGSTTWTTSEPSVGVYLRIPVRVFFARIVTGSDELPVHAFASAGLAEAQP